MYKIPNIQNQLYVFLHTNSELLEKEINNCIYSNIKKNKILSSKFNQEGKTLKTVKQ